MKPRTEVAALAQLAAPLAIQQVGQHMMGLVDAAMLGRYSDAALAGAGVGNNLYFGITSVGLGVVLGLDTVIPQALGAGRAEDARRLMGAGVRLAILVGLVGTLLVFASPLLLELADVDRDVIAEARPYVYVRALGVVPFLIMLALRSYLAAHGRTRPLVVAVIVGNVINAGLDLVLIYGAGLGVIGAALATTLINVGTVAFYAAAVRALDNHTPRPRSMGKDMTSIARYGLPVGGQLLAEIGIFALATVLAARLGKIPAGAHTIALNLSSLTFAFCLGIASATSVRVGHAVGAGNLALARQRGMIGVGLGVCMMACFAAVFVLIPGVLAALFTDEQAVIVAAIPLLQIAALFQLSDGTQAIGAGALRGRGDTAATLWANLLGHYVIGLPLMLALAFGAGLGAPGLWWGLSVGLTVTAAALVVRFLQVTPRA